MGLIKNDDEVVLDLIFSQMGEHKGSFRPNFAIGGLYGVLMLNQDKYSFDFFVDELEGVDKLRQKQSFWSKF
jgi:hypothetical protein